MGLLIGFNRPLGVAGRGIPDPTIQPTRAYVSPRTAFESRFFVDLPNQQEPQGQIGSCTAHGTSYPWEIAAWVRYRARVDLSRSFLYWIFREPRGWTQEDAGAIPEDAYRMMRDVGVCPEFMFDYTLKYWQAPPQECYVVAARNRNTAWSRPRSHDEIKTAMMEGLCTTFAFIVFEQSIESAERTGKWAKPTTSNYWGAHQVCAVGWDDEVTCPGYNPGSYLIANSWARWGIPHPQKGFDSYFWMPYDVMFDDNVVFSPAVLHGIPNISAEA